MSTDTPPLRIRDTARVRVRDDEQGNSIQAIGLAACEGSHGSWLSIRVSDVEQTEQGYMLLRLGARPAVFLLRRLTEVCRVAFGADTVAEAAREVDMRPVHVRHRDDVYAPGQPWRRGKWVEPMPKAVR